ncbi:hypothetical protein CA951_35885 [Rhodococcus sp. NCIMB 12038]|nr:hypothetical protein CA951_35885 [Rhodococcus sp. NCIMB 12038]
MRRRSSPNWPGASAAGHTPESQAGPNLVTEPAQLWARSGPAAWTLFDGPLPAWDAVHRH